MNYEKSLPLNEDNQETLMSRLARIETRIVKIMEALGIDPYTGRRQVRPQRQNPNQKDLYE